MAPSPLMMRDIASDANGVKSSLSSWDGCMAHSYCKWPVIVAIVIGSLIALSVLFCVARCLCCGVKCCADCMRCLTCCCRGRRSRGKYTPAPSQPVYQQPQPMPYQPQYQPNAASYGYRGTGAQVARFDLSGKKGNKSGYNEDALPEMPSWGNATHVKVEDHDAEPEHVELDQMNGQHGDQTSPHEPALPKISLSPSSTTLTTTSGLAAGVQPSPTPSAQQQHNPYSASPNPYSRTSPPPPLRNYSNFSNGDLGTPPSGPYHLGVTLGQQSTGVYHSTTSPTHQQPYQNPGYAASQYSSAYAPSESTRYESSTTTSGTGSGLYQSYQPQGYQPRQYQAQQTSPVERKPVHGSWREI